MLFRSLRTSSTLNNTNLVYNGGTSTTWIAPSNTASGTINLGSQTLDEQTLEHMKAHLKAVRAEQKAKELEKKHKTVYGRLKNYLGADT